MVVGRGGEQSEPVLNEPLHHPFLKGGVSALHKGLRGEVARGFGDQVCIYHRHPGQAAGEGDSPVGHCVYREVVAVFI